MHAGPSANVPDARVRRPVAAVPDDAGQHVADARPTPSIAEARDSDIVKSGLDPTDIANFRPVSNLTFMSKVVERAAATHVCERSAASSSVGVQTETLDRNSDVARLV